MQKGKQKPSKSKSNTKSKDSTKNNVNSYNHPKGIPPLLSVNHYKKLSLVQDAPKKEMKLSNEEKLVNDCKAMLLFVSFPLIFCFLISILREIELFFNLKGFFKLES